MRGFRWQLLIAVGGLILVFALLRTQTREPGTPAPAAVEGGAYVEALVGRVVRLNPLLDRYNPVDRDIDRLIYRGLVRADARGLPQPDLAQGWAVSADATLYTLTLREDALWHDGRPVTSDDVVYTYSKFQNDDYPGPPDLHEFWQQVKITRLDERTVQFQMPEPFAPFLDYLTTGLLPDHLLRGVSAGDLAEHPFNLQPVGAGPFRFENYIFEQGVIRGVSLVVFEQYDAKRPYLERIEFRLFPDDPSALAAFVAGEVDGIGRVGRSILGQVLLESQLNLYSARLPSIGVVFLHLKNPAKPFLGEKEVRQALLLGLNRQWLIDRVFAGQGVVPAGPILPDTWAFAERLQPPPFDPQRAGELLDAAGWTLPIGAAPRTAEYVRSKDGESLGFTLVYPDDELHREVAQVLQDDWSLIGVRVELAPARGEELLPRYLEMREYEAVLTDLNFLGEADPDPYPFWHDSQAGAGQNYADYTDRNTSVWLEQARTTPDLGRRIELYRNFQVRFQDQVPALLLYIPVYSFAVDAEMEGVSVGPFTEPSDRFSSVVGWHLLARQSLGSVLFGTSAP